jgi:transposase-like protein
MEAEISNGFNGIKTESQTRSNDITIAVGAPSIERANNLLATNTGSMPEPEVQAKKTSRRKLSAKYKLRILKEADACQRFGERAKLLRREGLYSTQVKEWHQARAAGGLGSLSPKKRGVKALPTNPLADRVSKLEKERAELCERLKKAEAVIELQKKISEIFGAANLPLSSEGSSCK